MGLAFKIKLKSDTSNLEMNSKLADLGLEGKYLPAFHDKEYYQENIVEFYNQATEAARVAMAHEDHIEAEITATRLRATNGEDRQGTYEEYHKLFSSYMTINTLDVEIGFDRCSIESMKALASFVLENKDSIEWVRNGDTLLERSEAETGSEIFEELEENDEPTMLPLDQQTNDEVQGGIPLRHWGLEANKTFAIMANVDYPVFMKKKVYEEDVYNSLYKTKDNASIFLLPTCPLGDEKFHERIYDEASKMSIQESYAVFHALCYPVTLKSFHGGKMISSVATDIKRIYSFEQMADTLRYLIEQENATLPSYRKVTFQGTKRYEPFQTESSVSSFRLSVINALYYAMKKTNKKEAYKIAIAELTNG